jgi:K+-sensing histidine kinase KdpD
LSAYGVSLAAIAAVIVVRLLLDPWLGERFPFMTVLLAVPFAAWYGGRGPALVALVAGAFAVAYFVLQPRYTLPIGQIDYQVGLVLYAIVCVASIAMFESVRRHSRQAEHRQQ